MKSGLLNVIFVFVSLLFIGMIFISPSNAKIDPAVIAGLWLFDDGAGKVIKDSSGNKLDGEVIGSIKWVDGKFGKAMEIDGGGGHVKIPDHVNPTVAITVTAWCKSSSPTWNQHGWLVEKRDAFILHNVQGTKNMAFCIVNGGPWNKPFSWDTGQIGPNDITEWHMYTGTFNSKTGDWKIWIDGEEKSKLACDKAELAPDNGPIFIGNDTCCAGRFGAGTVDEVAIFSVELGKAEIQAIYKQGLKTVALSVDKAGKASTTWAEVKTQY